MKSLVANKKAIGLQGEAIINRAYTMLESVDADLKGTAIDAIGKLQRDIIGFIFDIDNKYDSMDDILQNFLNGIMTTDQATAPAASTSQHAMSNEVCYTADGNDAGRITVTNMGFSVGAVIEPKKGNEDEDMQFVIKYVNDDGSVGAQRIQPNGKEGVDITIIDMDQLVNHHRHAQKRITLLESYPENAAIGSEDFKTTMLKRGRCVGCEASIGKQWVYEDVLSRAEASERARICPCRC